MNWATERRRAIEAAFETVDGRAELLVGIGALRTEDVIEMARDAKEAGADAGLLAPVSYQPLTEEEVFTLFETVGREVPGRDQGCGEAEYCAENRIHAVCLIRDTLTCVLEVSLKFLANSSSLVPYCVS